MIHTALAQFEKLLDGKSILILEEEEMEELIRAAVPNLRMEIEELSSSPVCTIEDHNRLYRLKRLADTLDAMPPLTLGRKEIFE